MDTMIKDDNHSRQHQVLIDAELLALLNDPKANLTEEQYDLIQSYFYSTGDRRDSSPLVDKEWIKKLLDDAIQSKYKKIAALVSQYHPGVQQVTPVQQETANILISSVQHLCLKIQKRKLDLSSKRILLSNEITAYVKVILELLDVIWLIIQEFKCKFEREKNQALDAYLDTMVDTLLLRIRSFHVSILLATYDDKLVASLESLRSMLNERLEIATKDTAEASDLLLHYQQLGPQFEKLRKAYGVVVNRIKVTEDDIQRMKHPQ